jgi:vibriolysin
VVFVDTTTGKIAARHPQIKYARALETRDCHQKTRRCRVVSTSSNAINTGDAAIDAAHNYAIATYDYYWYKHGRDSIDDTGLTLKSRAHYSRNYNNAFWDGSQMTYGDGDGVTFIPLSQDADVVAHELTHGVTERSSGLIYQNESGALNEAWSDIFGAMVDRQTGATGADIWLLGEDIYTPGTSGDGLRNMADPAAEGDYDYYPDRYTGLSDNGGVHWNSGIANLAFKLLVTGGSHPRGKTSVVVPAIDFDAAAAIFYNANVNCLTPNANFAAARYCTADVFGGSHVDAVHDAWDAVGVPDDPPPPPNPPIALTDGGPLGGQYATTGNIQPYTLGVAAGDSVTCTTSCNNGDADLYLRFGAEAEANPNSTNNECGSYSPDSNESCTTDAASSADTLYAGVHAYAGYTDLTITCTIDGTGGGSCYPKGNSCTTGADCCSGSCGGKPGSRTCK